MTPLLLLQAFRYLGLVFLLPPAIGSRLPDIFALPVALGDLTTGLLALTAAGCLRRRWAAGLALAWAANICGVVDFVYGYTLGIYLRIPLGVAYYIPALFNPAMVVAHAMSFALLWKRRKPSLHSSMESGYAVRRDARTVTIRCE